MKIKYVPSYERIPVAITYHYMGEKTYKEMMMKKAYYTIKQNAGYIKQLIPNELKMIYGIKIYGAAK